MPELEVSVENFFKLIDDIENLKETFNCSYLDCNLNSDRLIISAKPPMSHHLFYGQNKIRIKHTYFKKSAGEGGDKEACHSTASFPSQTGLQIKSKCGERGLLILKTGNYLFVGGKTPIFGIKFTILFKINQIY